MSHFSRCDVNINDLEALKEALGDLGLNFSVAGEHPVKVRGWQGQTQDAEIAISYGQYDVGIVDNNDGTYSMVADWWGIKHSGKTQEQIRNEIMQRYTYRRITTAARSKGFQITEEEVDEQGQIQVVLAKWG